jgi:hypothetical protein
MKLAAGRGQDLVDLEAPRTFHKPTLSERRPGQPTVLEIDLG